MTQEPVPSREAEAIREVGSTAVRRPAAWVLVLVSLVTVFAVATLEPVAEQLDDERMPDRDQPSPYLELFRNFGSQVAAALELIPAEGVVTANRRLLDARQDFEDRLEEESFLTRQLLPVVQWRLASRLDIGSDQAYFGDDGWLFYRPDVDYVTGRGFLEADVLRSRGRGGDPWREPPRPDPVPALIDLHRQLERRAIHLIVMPTPVKPAVHPEELSRRASGRTAPIQNPSFEDLLQRLRAGGVEVLDLAPILVAAKSETERAQYLRTDTHWTPQAVERAAQALVGRMETGGLLAGGSEERFIRREVQLQGRGDIAAMLLLPADRGAWGSERVTASVVVRTDGRFWRSDRTAQILLLGDSFSNVFSDPTLGWGAGAGLAEQLSFFLQRPVDKLAQNAGGALATRQMLARSLRGGENRLAGKRVVIYQFADRELASGDWRLIQLAEDPD
jgi:alginate O-acetyltransferase complex protein AlgJ